MLRRLVEENKIQLSQETYIKLLQEINIQLSQEINIQLSQEFMKSGFCLRQSNVENCSGP